MSGIDDKLKEIVKNNWGGANITEQVARIKQAFTDEGYYKTSFDLGMKVHMSDLMAENDRMRELFRQIVEWGQ